MNWWDIEEREKEKERSGPRKVGVDDGLRGRGKGFWSGRTWEREMTRVSWLKPQTAPWRHRHACQQSTAPNTRSLTRMIHSSLPHSHADTCHLCCFLFWFWICILVLFSDMGKVCVPVISAVNMNPDVGHDCWCLTSACFSSELLDCQSKSLLA